MQLFVLDRSPRRAVRYLADVHVRKMCLECAQILSCVLCACGGRPEPDMPRLYNPAHPVVKAVDTQTKINWVAAYNQALQREFLFRFGKSHAYSGLAVRYRELLGDGGPADCAGLARVFRDFSTNEADIVSAHRAYYRFKKTRIKTWRYTRRSEPPWLISGDAPAQSRVDEFLTAHI